jgi:uncharacterized protein with ATP-grasp and redox domains
MNQALQAAKKATDNEELIQEILTETAGLLHTIDMSCIPAETGKLVYKIVQDKTGNSDPFYIEKQKSIKEALAMLPELEKLTEESEDSLLTAIRIAIAGNVIDFGVNKVFDLKKDARKILKQEFAVSHYDDFKKSLNRAETVLYIGDNAGESVLDRVLIKELKRPVFYAVRESPIINDTTLQDALDSGLDKDAKILSSGVSEAGTIIKKSSAEFREIFEEADLVISKGQGNYEGLSEEKREIFFMLKAKCPVVAGSLKVPENSIVLKNNLNS